RLNGYCSLVGCLVAFVPDEKVDNVALLGDFNTIFVGPLPIAPEENAESARPPMVEGVIASLDRHFAQIQVRVAAQRMNHFVKNLLGLFYPRVFRGGGVKLYGGPVGGRVRRRRRCWRCLRCTGWSW